MKARTLSFADGCTWQLRVADASAGAFLERLAAIMELETEEIEVEPGVCALVVAVADPPANSAATMAAAVEKIQRGTTAYWALDAAWTEGDSFFGQALRLTTLFGVQAQARGGALVHAAMATHPSLAGGRGMPAGILLAAAGGTGKSTASRRLPSPWRSLCDDTVLVVRDAAGDYWAHPWPTWSCFLWGGPGGHWPTPQAMRLAGIFFLAQAPVDQAIPLGPGKAAAALTQSIAQASNQMTRGADTARLRAMHTAWFDAGAALARCIPCFELQLTLDGAFWIEVEKVMAMSS